MQKEKVLRFALLALSLVTSTAHAQEERAIIGPTSFSCGKWINTPKHTSEYFQLRYWVLGYLSGINMESGADFLRGRDADALTVWIDNYCRRNPLHAITQATTQLIEELRGH